MIVFRCYDPRTGGGGGIHSWYDQLDGAAKAAVDATLEQMSYENGLVGLPQYSPLRGACDGLSEIKIKLEDGRQFRILGFDGPGRNEFTLLKGFEKSAGHVDYGPHCNAAKWRKDAVERDNRRAPPCQFP